MLPYPARIRYWYQIPYYDLTILMISVIRTFSRIRIWSGSDARPENGKLDWYLIRSGSGLPDPIFIRAEMQEHYSIIFSLCLLWNNLSLRITCFPFFISFSCNFFSHIYSILDCWFYNLYKSSFFICWRLTWHGFVICLRKEERVLIRSYLVNLNLYFTRFWLLDWCVDGPKYSEIRII